MGYSLLELLLISFGLSITINNFKSLTNKNFIQNLKINNKFVEFVIETFLIVFIYLFVLSIAFFTTFYVLSILEILKPYNFTHSGEQEIYNLGRINWFSGENKFIYYWYSIIIEIIIIILFALVLLLVVRNKILVNGFIVVITLYSIFFGNLLSKSYINFELQNGEWFLVRGDASTKRWVFNILFMPWNQIGTISGEVLLVPSKTANFHNYSNLGTFSVLLWLPYLYIFLMSYFVLRKWNTLAIA